MGEWEDNDHSPSLRKTDGLIMDGLGCLADGCVVGLIPVVLLLAFVPASMFLFVK